MHVCVTVGGLSIQIIKYIVRNKVMDKYPVYNGDINGDINRDINNILIS